MLLVLAKRFGNLVFDIFSPDDIFHACIGGRVVVIELAVSTLLADGFSCGCSVMVCLL